MTKPKNFNRQKRDVFLESDYGVLWNDKLWVSLRGERMIQSKRQMFDHWDMDACANFDVSH